MTSILSSIRAWLPDGHRLPSNQWAARHRALLAILLAHVPVMVLWGLVAGFPLWHAVLDVVPLVVPAAFACRSELPRRVQEGAVALGLLNASAVLVHLMDGAVEAHFHFFVVVALLALYEEWFPYLLAFAYVLVHHLTMSLASSSAVFNHPDAVAHPLKWSLIHAFFIGAQGLICLVGWKVNEDSRRQAARSTERFSRAFTDAPIGMALVDMRGRVREANAALTDRWGRSTDERLVGRPVRDLVGGSIAPSAFPGPESADLPYADQSGWGHWRHAPLHDEGGGQIGWITHCVDITRRRALESDLTWQAHHDPLTGLGNRTLIIERLRQRVVEKRPFAVVFLDVDDFKVVNDSLGHSVGDELLVGLTARLQAAVAGAGVVARFGGDEFVLLLDDVDTAEHARQRAEAIAAQLKTPFALEGQPVYVNTSMGLRLCLPGEGVAAEAALRDADAAMYEAKRNGKGRVELFGEALREQALARLELEGALHSVLERDELFLAYQPVTDLPTGRTCGVEALLRWNHPTIGFVSPADFIPLAEQNGTINAIGAWVIDEACRQLASWTDPHLRVSVNVASQQLASGELVGQVRRALARHGLAPGRLCLEITETAALGRGEATSRTLAELGELGVRLAVDDFGVGYASLSHLRQLLPVDALKIDKSFIDGILGSPEDAAIVRGMIGLSGSLGLTVVAEGVEEAEQAELLTEWGCDKGQGYFFARPLPPHEIAERLAREQRAACPTAPPVVQEPAVAGASRRPSRPRLALPVAALAGA